MERTFQSYSVSSYIGGWLSFTPGHLCDAVGDAPYIKGLSSRLPCNAAEERVDSSIGEGIEGRYRQVFHVKHLTTGRRRELTKGAMSRSI